MALPFRFCQSANLIAPMDAMAILVSKVDILEMAPPYSQIEDTATATHACCQPSLVMPCPPLLRVSCHVALACKL